MTTWNPADKDATITLTNGDLTATATGDGIVRATTSFSTGSWYWEFNVGVGGNYTEVGVATSLGTYFVGYDDTGWSYSNSGKIFYDWRFGGYFVYGSSYTSGSRIGIAVNADTGKIWFSKNGVWQNGGDPAAGTGEAFSSLAGVLFPACSLSNGKAISAVFSSLDLIDPIPIGFSALDTPSITTFEYTFDFESTLKYIHSDQEFGFDFDFFVPEIPMLIPGGIITPPNEIPTPSNVLKPKAYVMFMDYKNNIAFEYSTWYVLTTASAFNVSNSKSNPLGSFSVTINKADLLNSRVWIGSDYDGQIIDPEGVIGAHTRKLVRIYYSNDNGATYSILFEGVPTSTPESYSYGNADFITISGVSIASFMQTTYFAPLEQWTGNAKKLVTVYVNRTMGNTSGGYIINFGNGYSWEDQDFGYTNALAAVQDILKVHSPSYWGYMDYSNDKATFIVGSRPTEFFDILEYDDSNIIDLGLDSLNGIITRCNVIGYDEDATDTAGAPALDIAKHGTNILNISSGLIKTEPIASVLANSYIEYSLVTQGLWSISCLLNPIVGIKKGISIVSAKSSLDVSGWIDTYSHSYQYGSVPKTTMSGYYTSR